MAGRVAAKLTRGRTELPYGIGGQPGEGFHGDEMDTKLAPVVRGGPSRLCTLMIDSSMQASSAIPAEMRRPARPGRRSRRQGVAGPAALPGLRRGGDVPPDPVAPWKRHHPRGRGFRPTHWAPVRPSSADGGCDWRPHPGLTVTASFRRSCRQGGTDHARATWPHRSSPYPVKVTPPARTPGKDLTARHWTPSSSPRQSRARDASCNTPGGILRPYDGKATAEVHDYHDDLTGVLASSLAKRAPGYTSLGFPDPRKLPYTPSADAARPARRKPAA